MDTTVQHLLFIINPQSGSKKTNDYQQLVKQYFEALQHKITIYTLQGKNDVPAIKKLIANTNPHKMIAVGGDGTLNLVAEILLGSKTLMGIIPAGSANGMAKELGIPENFNEAMLLVVNGTGRATDLISINNSSISLHLSDLGLNARLVKYFEKDNLRGKLGYAKVAFKIFWERRNMRVTITANGKKISRVAFMVVLANASKYGTGAAINPIGNLFDGLFEIVIVRKLAVLEILKMWFKPKPFKKENIEIIQATQVLVETRRGVHFQVDGEYKGKLTRVTAKILAGKLQLIVPDNYK